MYEICNISPQDLSRPYPVEARLLHKELKVETRFNDWIERRISIYGFEENQDYIIVIKPTKGRPKKEYFLTIDMAKELAMVENNEAGRKIRRYFIEVEKQFRQQFLSTCPATDNMSTRIAGYKGQLARRKKEIEELRWELAAAHNKIKELEAKNDPKIWLMEHNLLDLAGSLSRQNKELQDFALQLELIARDLKERAKTAQFFLDQITKYYPKAKNVIKTAKERK